MQNYDQILKSVQANQYAPVYLLCGEESYYIDQLCDYIETHALDEMAREFDQTVVYGRDLPNADIATAVAAARGFAMMGGNKVVIVKEAQTIKKWESLSLYLDNPQPTSILVICYKYGTPDKRQAWWKKLDKCGVVMVADKLRDYKVEEWIRTYLSERCASHTQLTIDPKVPRLLADYLGADLTAIVGAVDKLIDGLPEGVNVIDAALVERNVGISKDFNVFELQDALIKGDVVKANRITQYFASSKDHPMVKELGILYGFFANLMMYHYLPDKSERAAAPALGINPFFVKDYAAAAKRYPAGKTFKIIGYFREIDARSKGINNPSAKDSDLWKELIYKIMH
ncbi:MAG: DNA polymerase III subunit delta [Paludibacteraceae bacterium]|nr:DNA polymerase III subunit delta [Paludibacteraceae bacterium]